MSSSANLKVKMEAYDALPYFDQEYSFPAVQEEVLQMIEHEMKCFKPPVDSYLGNLPYPDLKFSRSPGFKAEFDRVSRRIKGVAVRQGEEDTYRMESRIDLKRYAVPGPGTEKDKAAILSALYNARAQYEHQTSRRFNLQRAQEENFRESMTDYASNVEAVAQQMQTTVADVNHERNKVNMDRMTNQRAAMDHIVKLTGKRDHTMHRVHQLKAAIEELKSKKVRR